ncbi:hypothetical protein DMT42_35950 [Streptomyces actuosus]|uniref:Uncharacterized protein n=2 Tax=Streptomyces TaxID=1883 RepID=A0A2U9PF41_STRAS|nr:hypothetical protein DMT42_35950 [Streptomyces actuosus]
MPTQAGPAEPAAVSGHRRWHTTYAGRADVPHANAVTRELAGAMHARVDRIGQARDLAGRWQDRTLRRQQREIRQLPDVTGEKLARWTADHVLNARKRPVPSFGFSLAPVLTHSVAAQRQRRTRGLLLAAVAALILVRHPWGAGALVVVALLYQYLIVAERFRSLLRWGLSSLVPMIVLAAGGFVAWTLLRSNSLALESLLHDAVSAGVWLTTLSSAVYTLDRWVAVAYPVSLRPSREGITSRPRFAPRASARIAECQAAETWQSTPYKKEEGGVHRFVGAGRDAWRSGGPRIQLTPARRAADDKATEGDGDSRRPSREADAETVGNPVQSGIRKFEADELLDKVRDELMGLRGVLVETHALPHCEVFETLAVPQSRWSGLSRTPERGRRAAAAVSSEKASGAPWPEAQEMVDEGRQAPSGHTSRRYLAAQVVDWGGQIVVTVFAHAALEGKTLHFVTRPHVLAPLKPEVSVTPTTGKALARTILLAPVHGLGDTIALAHKAYGVVLRALSSVMPGVLGHAVRHQVARSMDRTAEVDANPVSLREHCALVEPEDMHQAEDAARHISILQSRMFSAVSAFLDDHGMFTGDFRRQAQDIVTQIFINGDHNQVNTGTVNGSQTQSNPSDGTAAKG